MMLVKIMPSRGLNETPFQLPPPTAPGNNTMFRPSSHGVYGTESTRLYFSQSALQYASCSGVMPFGRSSFFIELRASGAGFTGNGCVGDDFSPGTSLCGTGRS